jgi:hypothetical protein
MPLRILALILVVAIQAAPVHAQHTEPGTGYWYEGVVTHGQGKATVESNEPRPLQEAMEALAKEYGWTIDYEDPAYSADEGVERTDPKFVASHPGEKHHLVGGHRFESEFPENPNTGASVSEEKVALQKVIADYDNSRNPGKFSLLAEGGGRFAVVGTTGGAGQTPIGVLDSPITVDIKNTNGSWALDKICNSLTASSGVQVRVLQYPLNVFVQTQITLHAENKPARDVLRAVLARTSQKLTWSLLYDIDDKTYYLNLIPVVKVNTGPAGQIR